MPEDEVEGGGKRQRRGSNPVASNPVAASSRFEEFVGLRQMSARSAMACQDSFEATVGLDEVEKITLSSLLLLDIW